MAVRETHAQALLRWEKLHVLQDHYSEFTILLEQVMALLGFHTTDIQRDIANFIAHGPDYLMVEAQRGQAKTTIAAAYAVWCLIMDPTYRVLIISAGGTQASEISTLIIRIIMTMPELECLRPDTNNGDRSSVDHFDVHYTLKGVDKSPSVACVGITAMLQGKRAHLLIADDVEASKNSATATQRAQLLHLTLDFVSISTQRIIWLGTPQTSDSIYNTLPARGVTLRIWPGRYPTPEQMSNYGEHLAPLLARRIDRNPALCFGGGLAGDQGQPTDPVLLDEAKLQAKELDQGTSYFQLQHMLNTRLTDKLRHPLKTDQLIMLAVQDAMPISVVRGMTSSTLVDQRVHGFSFKIQTPHDISKETAKFSGLMAYIDPAGGGVNADETAYSVTGFLNGTITALEVGGVPGGYSKETLEELARRLVALRVNLVKIEKNMGFGAFLEVFAPILRSEALKHAHTVGLDEDYVTGQKELRIIATLEPVINQGRLCISPRVIEQDIADCERYAATHRQSYSLFFQLAKITKDRGALVHDDRLDALEGSVRHWQAALKIDQQQQVARQRERERQELLRDPLGHNRYKQPGAAVKSILDRYK